MKKKETNKVPKKKKGKGGRPLITISKIEVEKLARLGATNIEIAGFFGCSDDTITRRFADNLVKGRASRKIRLRQIQWRAAENGSITMMIFLGKSELHQTDRSEITMKGSMNISKELEEMSTDELIKECKRHGVEVPA